MLQFLFLPSMLQCFHFCFPECESVGESHYINYVHCAYFVTNGEEQSTSLLFKQIEEICVLLHIYLCEREVLCKLTGSPSPVHTLGISFVEKNEKLYHVQDFMCTIRAVGNPGVTWKEAPLESRGFNSIL